MIEKEIKVLNINNSTIESLLISKGCVLCKDEIQENITYRGDNLSSIRLRKTNSLITGLVSYELTKNTNIPERVYDENCTIHDEKSIDITEQEFYTAQKIFSCIGLQQSIRGKKHRKSYHLNGFLYEIDDWIDSLLPIVYLEIEVQDNNLKIIDGLKQIWTDSEIDKLVISTEGISSLVKIHRNKGINTYIESLKK